MKLFNFFTIFTAISAQRLQPPAPPAELITAAALEALADVDSSINVNDGSHASQAAHAVDAETDDSPLVPIDSNTNPFGGSKSTNHNSHVAVTSGSHNHQNGSTYGPNDGQYSGHDDGSTSWNPDDSTTWNPDWSGPYGSADQSDGSVWDPPASADDPPKPDGVHIRGDMVAQLRGTMKSS
eukprot:scaffold248345_cov39-Cyclotella_meneghiniana.AAC.2